MNWRSKAVATSERKCLECLAEGGAFVARDIKTSGNNGRPMGDNFTWEALLNLERSGLVCRASDYENPRSYHQWKISGCGLLSLGSVT